MLPAILVTTMILTWSPEQLIKDYFMEKYPWPEIRVQSITANDTLPDVPPESILLVKGFPGKSTFLMKFPSSKTLEYDVKVEAFDWVVKSGRPLRKGEVFDEKNVYRILKNTRYIKRGALDDKDMVVGKILNYSIPANRTITNRLIKSVPDIKKGQKVFLVFDNKNIRIKTIGIAKESGNIGEYITAATKYTKKKISGKIVDSKTVMVGH